MFDWHVTVKMSLSLIEQNYIYSLPVKMSLTDTSIHDILENKNNSKYLSLIEQNWGMNNNLQQH